MDRRDRDQRRERDRVPGNRDGRTGPGTGIMGRDHGPDPCTGKSQKVAGNPANLHPHPSKKNPLSKPGPAAQNRGITSARRVFKLSGIVSPLVVLSCRHEYVSLHYVQ